MPFRGMNTIKKLTCGEVYARLMVADSPFSTHRCPNPEARRATMLPDKPEDWPRVFEQHLNAGDLDAVVTLYEPEARFVTL
jgi:hypothetical protein